MVNGSLKLIIHQKFLLLLFFLYLWPGQNTFGSGIPTYPILFYAALFRLNLFRHEDPAKTVIIITPLFHDFFVICRFLSKLTNFFLWKTVSVKQFGSRSSSTFCLSWSLSKLFSVTDTPKKRIKIGIHSHHSEVVVRILFL